MSRSGRCYDPDLDPISGVHYDRATDPIAMLEVCLDESSTDAGSQILCVAGYLFSNGSRRKLEKKWDKTLDKAGVSVFHMRDHKSPRSLKLLPGETEPQRIKRHTKMFTGQEAVNK